MSKFNWSNFIPTEDVPPTITEALLRSERLLQADTPAWLQLRAEMALNELLRKVRQQPGAWERYITLDGFGVTIAFNNDAGERIYDAVFTFVPGGQYLLRYRLVFMTIEESDWRSQSSGFNFAV